MRSAAAWIPARRVEPKAAIFAWRSLSFLTSVKERGVARVGSRPSALDVVDAEIVEPLGDLQLVGDGERNVFGLASVAQSGVVDL